MEIRFQTGNNWKSDAALFFVFEEEEFTSIEQRHAALFKHASWISIAPAWRDYKAKEKNLLLLYGHKDNDISRAYAVGLGKKEKFKIETLRDAVATAVKACKSLGIESIGLDTTSLKSIFQYLPKEQASFEYIIEEACTASLLSLYSYKVYKTEKDTSTEPKVLNLFSDEEHFPDNIQKSARLAEATSAGVAMARNLSNDPANVLTPVAFAEKAEEVAKKYDFKCSIFDQKKLQELGMNAFYSVARGSVNEARLIILEYTPKECKNTKPYVFVGKGITFDSGGISLKPSKGMEEMKTDMSGAADLLGLFEALGQAKFVCEPDRPIIALLGCAENMPDGNAVKPGDVIHTYNGKTVEITNTDAEGRLVLIDVLAYAQKTYKPEVIIDVATLTGACVVALGDEAAGLFVNDESLCQNLLKASDRTGEVIWRMPLWENMIKKMKSNIADLDNAGAREGGAISAAVFIKQFIEEGQTWAHLDIAGPNYSSAEKPTCSSGATGFGTRLLIDYVLNN